MRQRAAFDPALKQYPNAYRAGEPDFLVAATGQRWTNARRAAMNHVLAAIAATTWGQHLVLRGSVTMAAWVGEAAREPGDLDFVVTPHTITSDSTDARTLLDDIKTAIRTATGAGLQPDRITESATWTYERADGRRLLIPFSTPEAPDGHVQIDIVFGERLPVPPEALTLPDVDKPLLAAPAPLALAWKLLWLATDRYPQGRLVQLHRRVLRNHRHRRAVGQTARTGPRPHLDLTKPEQVDRTGTRSIRLVIGGSARQAASTTAAVWDHG
ncbi:nucleotidyl transferase AbiEii/AbiGii toxin family protein [Micromonospora sp. DT53]|uniref:nucleotidyl transferase AbiEii/AbiGii toxin family protein n=1 Tax=Micromonospora sp. DT53 TaxID=3393444 RepID=UPI003CE6A7BC